MVAARIAKLDEGRPPKTAPIGAVSQKDAAEKLSVGHRSVQRAREVLNKGAPELAAKVERGEIRVSTAADIARLDKVVQREICERDKHGIKDEITRLRRAEAGMGGPHSEIKRISKTTSRRRLSKTKPTNTSLSKRRALDQSHQREQKTAD